MARRAEQVDVRGSLKTDATKPGWSVKLGDVADRVPAGAPVRRSPDLAGFSYQVRTRRADAAASRYAWPSSSGTPRVRPDPAR